MLSIVICSRRLSDYDALSSNIADTIGVPYELIRVDNSASQYGICQAYNLGAGRSKYETLCFVHEDVKFVTPNWGSLLLSLFTDSSIGLVGVAGGKYKSKHIGLAYNATSKDMLRLNILQHGEGVVKHDYLNPDKLPWEEVVSIDGVFMAAPKKIWKEHPFDEHTLKGFHFYDMDFSLQIGTEKKVIVSYEILLEHFSLGTLDERWYDQALIAHKKWRPFLPRTVAVLSNEVLEELEVENATFLFFFLVKHGFPRRQRLKQLWTVICLRPFRKYHLPLLSLALK